MFNRASWNMIGITAGISAMAFGFSLFSTTKINTPLQYKPMSFKGKVESFADIEDLEYTKGCKFYFYEVIQGRNDVKITKAREFKIGLGDRNKMFKSVEEKIKDCTKNRYFYIKWNDIKNK